MKAFVINRNHGDEQTVRAESFATVGDFIDFYGPQVDGTPVVLRVRAGWVHTIELVNT